MPKFQIAGFITQYEPKYERLRELSKPFLYEGEKNADFTLVRTDSEISKLHSRMAENATYADAEELAYAAAFNKAIISYGAMLIHSSAIIADGRAYLFSAGSGVGKSTHTRLWKQLYGDQISYINDDKPVVKIDDGSVTVCGTPFDGGSGIANNISAPLGGIIFIQRGEENSISKLISTNQIIQRLYFATSHFVSRDTADSMLRNFEQLINATDFYNLICNMTPEAAKTAHDFLIK